MSRELTYISDKNKFVAINKVSVPFHDLGFERGFGVFEAFVLYGKKIIGLDDHLDRLLSGALKIGLKHNFSKKFILDKIKEGIEKTELKKATIKIVLTGGNGSGLNIVGNGRLYIEFSKYHNYPESQYKKGIKAFADKDFKVLHNLKTLDYLEAVISHNRGKNKGFDESLRVLDNKIVEGTNFNIAFVKEKKIYIPKKNVLFGVTIKNVEMVAKKMGFKIINEPIGENDLKKIDEAFIASSNREVIPLVQINKIKIGDGLPGAITKSIHEGYKKLSE